MAAKWQRRFGAVLILLFLLWLPYEDTEIWMSAILASEFCIWIGLRLWGRHATWLTALGLGAGLGATWPVLTITLMAFKSGLHGHGFPDFTTRQIVTVWNLVPFSLLAGGLFALLLQLFLTKATLVSPKTN